MKMQSILRLLYMAVSFLTVSAVIADPSEPESTASNSSLQTTIKKEKTVWKKVKKFLIHNRAVQNTIVPVLMKIEQIKDEGMSRTDIAKAVMYGSLAYMLIRYYRSFSLKSLDTFSSAYDQRAYQTAYNQTKCDHDFTLKDEPSFSVNSASALVFTAGMGATLYLFYAKEYDLNKFDEQAFELESLLDPETI